MTRRLACCFTFALAVLFVASPRAAVAQPVWKHAGEMTTPRVFGSAAALGDGRVLIAGGLVDINSSPSLVAAVDIFDPATGITVSAPPLPEGRFWLKAISLLDGRVALFGGLGTTLVREPAFYNPGTNTWSIGAPVPGSGIFLANIARLQDGRVLVAGSIDDWTAANIYDVVSNTWSVTPPMPHARTAGAILTMTDGRVILAGGYQDLSADIYDPVSNTWTSTGEKTIWDQGESTLVQLPDGRVAHVTLSGEIELYDAATNSWTTAASHGQLLESAIGILLADGRIMVAGGVPIPGGWATPDSIDTNNTTIYDPASNTWAPGPPMPASHAITAAVPLGGGRYVVLGHHRSPNTSIDIVGPNRAPVANAGPDIAAGTCDSCLSGVQVDGSASSDPDGDALTYIWSLGASVLTATAQPTAVIPLGPGTWTLTLTVRDELGAEDSDTVTVAIGNVETAYRAQISNLQSQIADLQAQLALERERNGRSTAPLTDHYELFLRKLFRDPQFELPGASSFDELGPIFGAIEKLDRGSSKFIYRQLGGRRLHQPHRGRLKAHWDDDCDWDDDDDHGNPKKR